MELAFALLAFELGDLRAHDIGARTDHLEYGVLQRLADVVFAWVHGRFGWGGLSILTGLCAAISAALIGVVVIRAGACLGPSSTASDRIASTNRTPMSRLAIWKPQR